MNSELRSIKHHFDIAINHLDFFYPLINTIFIKSAENVNYELFKESVKEFNQSFSFYSIGNVTIEKTISDAKLYLDKKELIRFYDFAKDAIVIKQNHLEQLLKSNADEVNKETNRKLENIFFENVSFGLKTLPIRRIEPNSVFVNDLINGIKKYFNEFEKSIDEITSIVKTLPPQPININESRTKKVIFETISNIDDKGWQYAFVSEQDYNLFTDLLTNFFEYKPYTLPETIIQLKRTCKTKVAKALGEIHKELSNENKLSTDTKYFQLIRVLSHFEKETEGDLYKALTR